MFWLRNCLVGPPCATGLSGLAAGGGGIGLGRWVAAGAGGVAAAATAIGAGAGAGASAGCMVDRCSAPPENAGVAPAAACGGGFGSVMSVFMALAAVYVQVLACYASGV